MFLFRTLFIHTFTSVLDAVSGQHPLLVSTEQVAAWIPEAVCMQRLDERSFTPAEDQTQVIQSVVTHYTDNSSGSSMGKVKLFCYMPWRFLVV
jgi:hypothetical protein